MRGRLVVLFLFAAAAAAQDAGGVAREFIEAEQRAFGFYEREDWDAAIAAFEAQIAVFADNPRPYYNIACAYARKGDAARAATWLRISIARGWRDAEHLAADPDFAAVRESDEFRACVAHLEKVREADPDPLPRRLPPETASTASSVRVILAASYFQEQAVRRAEPLLGEHDYRKRLFDAYDRRMAMLTRYLMENGDARDADQAAQARVDTATRYLEEADATREADRPLVEAAAHYVLATSEEFLRGYPGSPGLARVLLLRGHALRRLGRNYTAEQALRVVVADHPGTDDALRARLQLCMLLADAADRRGELRAAFQALRADAKDNPAIGVTLDGAEMLKPRLLAEGLPAPAASLVRDAAPGTTCILAFVGVGSPASERRLAALRAVEPGSARLVVVAVDPTGGTPEEETRAWLAKHAPGLPARTDADAAVVALGLARVPTVIVVSAPSDVLAVDPTDAELARLLGKRGG